MSLQGVSQCPLLGHCLMEMGPGHKYTHTYIDICVCMPLQGVCQCPLLVHCLMETGLAADWIGQQDRQLAGTTDWIGQLGRQLAGTADWIE